MKSMSQHQHTEGEQLILTEMLEQNFVHRHRNSHVTVFSCFAIVNGKAGCIISAHGNSARSAAMESLLQAK